MPRILALCLLLSLVACVSKLPLPDESWRLIGKLSLRTKTESRILGIDWRHVAGENAIVLSGPLGVKVASIMTERGKLILDTGDAIILYDENDQVSKGDLAGLRLPWRQLAIWVRSGETVITSEGNWQFQITDVSAEGPVSMRLEHPEISMKLKVNRWEIH